VHGVGGVVLRWWRRLDAERGGLGRGVGELGNARGPRDAKAAEATRERRDVVCLVRQVDFRKVGEGGSHLLVEQPGELRGELGWVRAEQEANLRDDALRQENGLKLLRENSNARKKGVKSVKT